jgi:hypothetical protein
MSTQDILLWGAMLCLGFIGGAAIYFEMASSKRSKRPTASHGPEGHSHQPKTRV